MKYIDDNKENYEWDIEDFTNQNFIKIDDGTTAFNVYMMGQNIAHDMWASGYFDENDIIINDSDIFDWICHNFQDIFLEIRKEIIYQIKYNPDINQGNNIKISENCIEEYIDEHINSDNPYEEHANGDIIILSKYDLGRQIILENFEEDEDIYIDKIYDLVEQYLNDIVCGVLNGAVEYCYNNDLHIKM